MKNITVKKLLNIRGASLIEALVSLTLLSVIVLGVDAVQITSFKKNAISYYVSVAQQQVDILIEQLSAGYTLSKVLSQWNAQNRLVLPQGAGTVTEIWPHYQYAIVWGGYALSQCQKNKIGSMGCLHDTFLVVIEENYRDHWQLVLLFYNQ